MGLNNSTINLIKDTMGFLSLGFVLAWAMFGVLPGLEQTQIKALEAGYIEQQRAVLKATVENEAMRILELRNLLLEEGLSQGHVRRTIESQVLLYRYGPKGFGYLFAFNKDLDYILHPLEPNLIGKRLSDVITPDGQNLGQIFLDALEGTRIRAGFVEYQYPRPYDKVPDYKTSYVQYIPEFDWFLGSGFYYSDLDEAFRNFRDITKANIRETQTWVFIALAIFLVVFLSISILMYLKIRRNEQELADHVVQLEQYKLILDESSLVSRTDLNGRILYVNETFIQATGYTREQVLGKSHNIERHPDTPLELFRDLWDTITKGQVWNGVLKNRRADGSSYIKRATIVPLKNAAGQIHAYLSSGQDITELVENRRHLANAFNTDTLTGLGSRIRLLNDLDRIESPVIALIDIEGFSNLNQTFGSKIGDQVLREFGETVLHEAQFYNGSAYRTNADTFAILWSGQGDETRVAKALAMPEQLHMLNITVDDKKIALILRVGVSANGKDSFMYADMALKQARQGHKRAVLFDAKTVNSLDPNSNMATLQKLYWALDHDLVYPVFQPIVDLKNGAIKKYECLMRVDDEVGTTLMPGDFIEISKKTRLYQLLTCRIIEKCIAVFRKTDHEFSINLTLEDLANTETMAFLLTQARHEDIARRLIVEIVETEELKDFEGANQALDDLRASGIRIAIDDFGSGYASFEYLLKLSPSFIKIDRAIVSQLQTDPRAMQLLRSIVGFAKNSNLSTVAEYIDSPSILALVTELGVDYGQGWQIGKALPHLLA